MTERKKYSRNNHTEDTTRGRSKKSDPVFYSVSKASVMHHGEYHFHCRHPPKPFFGLFFRQENFVKHKLLCFTTKNFLISDVRHQDLMRHGMVKRKELWYNIMRGIRNHIGGDTAMLTEEKDLQKYTLDGVMIGKRIKTARKAKKYTQEELAAKCHCTSTHISNIENGKIGLSLELLYALSIVLEKSLDYFVMDSEGTAPEIKVNFEIIPKLISCDQDTIDFVNGLFERAITYRDKMTEKLSKDGKNGTDE